MEDQITSIFSDISAYWVVGVLIAAFVIGWVVYQYREEKIILIRLQIQPLVLIQI